MSASRSILIVAGEASADLHASALVRELRELAPGYRFVGVGGPGLKKEGVDIMVEASSLSIAGISGWWHRIPEIYRYFRKLCAWAQQERPAAAILLDLPDFNLMLAQKLKRLGIPVLYYISPQIWAWRKYRIHKIARTVSKMFVLFPFEERYYRERGVEAEFVGHPLLDRLPARAAYRSPAERRQSPRLALLPGSRGSELKHHAETLKNFAVEFKRKFPEAQFRVPVAPTLDLSEVKRAIAVLGVEFTTDGAESVLAWSDLALVASGTATLETALIGTPFLLFYRVSVTNAFLKEHVIRYTGNIGMPNLLLGREVFREYFQERFTVPSLVAETTSLIQSPERYQEQIEAHQQLRKLLGESGGSRRVAEGIAKFLQSPAREEKGASDAFQVSPAST